MPSSGPALLIQQPFPGSTARLCAAQTLQSGHRPDDRLCTTLIRVCAQHGQASTALSLYDWMRAPAAEGGAGLTPTVFTYTAAMRAALTGSMMDRALQVGRRLPAAPACWQPASPCCLPVAAERPGCVPAALFTLPIALSL